MPTMETRVQNAKPADTRAACPDTPGHPLRGRTDVCLSCRSACSGWFSGLVVFGG
jgi:hypothetical protein